MKYSLIVLKSFLLSTSSIWALSSEEIARRAFTSAVSLVLFDDYGKAIKIGSGFFVKDGIIATNYHVIEGASSGIAKRVGRQNKLVLKSVIATNARVDLALIQVDKTGIPSLPLSSGRRLAVGQKVFAVGSPEGLEGTFSQGIVSSIREIGEDYYIQMTAPISSGSSGGPVLNDQGIVVGVSVATIANGQNLNFAVPSKYLLDLISTTQTNLVSKEAASGRLNVQRFTGSTMFDSSNILQPKTGTVTNGGAGTKAKNLIDQKPASNDTNSNDTLIFSR